MQNADIVVDVVGTEVSHMRMYFEQVVEVEVDDIVERIEDSGRLVAVAERGN
jgi:hypothetical protein